MRKKQNERPNVRGVSIWSRNGDSSRKGCAVNGQMTTAMHKLSTPPPLSRRMQFTLVATRRTPHGASRLMQAMSVSLVKTRRAPFRNSRDARVYGHPTTSCANRIHLPASLSRALPSLTSCPPVEPLLLALRPTPCITYMPGDEDVPVDQRHA